VSATWDEFERLELRVGVVTEVEEFPEARVPAYKLTVDFGSEIGTKRSSARLTHYPRDAILGRQVVCALGFPVKRIAGFPVRGARARRVQRRARRGAVEARPGRRARLSDRVNRASYLLVVATSDRGGVGCGRPGRGSRASGGGPKISPRSKRRSPSTCTIFRHPPFHIDPDGRWDLGKRSGLRTFGPA
jgi:tRNA-binding protein